jgi:hypothetical protein
MPSGAALQKAGGDGVTQANAHYLVMGLFPPEHHLRRLKVSERNWTTVLDLVTRCAENAIEITRPDRAQDTPPYMHSLK